MKLEFLNVWGGKTGNILLGYLKNRAPITDVFCFQEADKDFPNIAGMAMRGFEKYTTNKKVGEHDVFTQTTMVRKGLRVDVDWPVLSDIEGVGLGMVTELSTRWGVYTVVNFHGVSRPGDKMDSDKRLEQSRRLIEYFKNTNRLIIGGDFNLEKEIESVRMFERNGFDNWINRSGIINTRNENVWKRYPESKQHYSGWVYTRGIKVKNFEVPQENLASDHLPMILEVE